MVWEDGRGNPASYPIPFFRMDSAADAADHRVQGGVGFNENAILFGQRQSIGIQQPLGMQVRHDRLILAAAAAEERVANADQQVLGELRDRQARHAGAAPGARAFGGFARGDAQIRELQILDGGRGYLIIRLWFISAQTAIKKSM